MLFVRSWLSFVGEKSCIVNSSRSFTPRCRNVLVMGVVFSTRIAHARLISVYFSDNMSSVKLHGLCRSVLSAKVKANQGLAPSLESASHERLWCRVYVSWCSSDSPFHITKERLPTLHIKPFISHPTRISVPSCDSLSRLVLHSLQYPSSGVIVLTSRHNPHHTAFCTSGLWPIVFIMQNVLYILRLLMCLLVVHNFLPPFSFHCPLRSPLSSPI